VVQIAHLATGNYWEHMNMAIVPGTDGIVQVTMKITENLKQVYGGIHGGAIAGLLDSTIAVAVNQQLDSDEGALTVEMKINFLRSANSGTLWGEGKVIKKGSKLIVAQGEIKDDMDNLVAFGTATFMITKPVI